MSTKKKDLVAIIKANPGCQASIDNDNWQLYKTLPAGFDAWDDEKQGDWWDDASNKLASDRDDFEWPRGKGNFASCCYGGDLLEALAIIAGINVASV